MFCVIDNAVWCAFTADSATACNGNYFIDVSEDSPFDSKLKRYRVSSPFVTAIGLISCVVNRHTALAQKPIAGAFVVMTRTSHAPGNLLQICSAIKYPTPRRRAPRTTKKSAISQIRDRKYLEFDRAGS